MLAVHLFGAEVTQLVVYVALRRNIRVAWELCVYDTRVVRGWQGELEWSDTAERRQKGASLMSTTTPRLQRPNTNDRDGWCAYWQALDQPWRAEPEIDTNRQKYLEGCLAIVPDSAQQRCPFKDVVLSRADVEWLLSTCGKEKKPVDLRASLLQEGNFSGLPLEGASLIWAHLEGADLSGAHLEGADLSGAFFTGATDLSGIVLGNQQVGFASLAGVRWGEVDLSVVDWTQVNVLGGQSAASGGLAGTRAK